MCGADFGGLRMDTVTLYRINCYHAPREELIGESFSLVPWDEDDATMKGEDDGGKDYELPKGYELSAEDGVPVILNPDGRPCSLQGHNGCPLLIDEAKKLAILMERDKKILRQRELAHLTRAQLAERLEVSQALLYQWEHCEVEPDVRTLKRIADILQCEILELI